MTLPEHISSQLRSHQPPLVAHLYSLAKRGISSTDWSDPGAGKTFVTAAVLAMLQEPTVVVVPKISVTAWHRAAALFGDKISVVGYEALRTGTKDFGRWTRGAQPDDPQSLVFFKCQCCQRRINPVDPTDRCYTNPAGVHCVEVKKKPWNPGDFKWHPGVRRVVFDEAHRCGGLDSLNSEMLVAAVRQRIPTTTLSATMASSPLELKALGYALGLHRLVDYPAFLRRNGCGVLPPLRGYRWIAGKERQLEVMASLRAQIIPSRGIRITREEIPNFPESDVRADLYDLEESGEIERSYREMADALAELEQRERSDKAPDHPLTALLRAQQRIELLKVPLAEYLADEYRAKGYSVGFFVNFSQTLAELRKRRNCDCYIDGTQTGNTTKRQACIDAFQRNEEREIVVNSEAGGVSVSLHDLDGRFPRVGLAMPCFSARRMNQLLGRFPRVDGRSKSVYHILLAAGTSDVQVHRALRGKLNNMDALNDADLCPDNLRPFAQKLSRL